MDDEDEFLSELNYQVNKMKLKIKLLYGLVGILSLFGIGISTLFFILISKI